MTHKPIPTLLEDLLDHAQRIRDIYESADSIQAFHEDRKARDAVLWNLVVLGEVSNRLGREYQDEHPEIPWSGIIAQRNVIAHGYDALNWDRLIDVVQNDIPSVIQHAQRLLDAYGPPPEID